ncbi:MAG: hypothetical protein WBM14_14635 [Terracidiphilus sp.]
MVALDGERMLTAWEQGRERQDPWRALALLELALPERDAGALAALPLAERNALLLRLRTMTFGARIDGFAVCPECGAQLEFALNAEDIEPQLHAPSEESWLEQETEMRMRPANSRDLAASMAAKNETEARALLVARTLKLSDAANIAATRPEWAERAEWIDRFERLNASAEIRCVLFCAGCGHRPVLDFDIARFLWREVALAARRLLAEIHRLARAYGWSEQSIAAMSASRRGAYLEMLDA